MLLIFAFTFHDMTRRFNNYRTITISINRYEIFNDQNKRWNEKLRTVNSVNIIFPFRIKRYETKMWAYLNVGVKEIESRKRKREIGRERLPRLRNAVWNKIAGYHFMQFSFKASCRLNSSFLCFSFTYYCGDRGSKNCETFSERYRNFSRHVCIYLYIYIHISCFCSLIGTAYSGRLNFHNNCERAKRSPCHSTRQYSRCSRFNGLGPLKLARPLTDIYSNIYFTHFSLRSSNTSPIHSCSSPSPSPVFRVGGWLWD